MLYLATAPAGCWSPLSVSPWSLTSACSVFPRRPSCSLATLSRSLWSMLRSETCIDRVIISCTGRQMRMIFGDFFINITITESHRLARVRSGETDLYYHPPSYIGSSLSIVSVSFLLLLLFLLFLLFLLLILFLLDLDVESIQQGGPDLITRPRRLATGLEDLSN